MKKLFLSVFLFLYFFAAYAQELSPFRVMFYNVENLFDTQKEPDKNDSEFLPDAIRAWNRNRYKKKLTNISRVITAVGEWAPPALVGLCEVENDRVLRDLTRYSPLKNHDYRYIMTNSPDDRGIDVALLYQRHQFKLLNHQSIPVPLNGRTTRDILHVTGLLLTRDTLDVFVVHFPSRSEGAKKSEPRRLHAARILRSAVDSLYNIRNEARIIIMGDFNDYPDSRSLKEVLKAKLPEEIPNRNELYQLLANQLRKTGYGSYNYQGEWGQLDHIIVSGLLLNPDNRFYTTEESAKIFRAPFLLIPNEKYGGERPLRTYYGMKYEGGFSDHLPVYTDFVIKTDFN